MALVHPYQERVTYQPSHYMFDNEKNGNVTLESKNYIKYLGVLVDKNLTWKYHIDDAITVKFPALNTSSNIFTKH